MAETELAAASGATRAREDAALVELFGRTRTESGRTLLELADERPMLLLFLRHFGDSFTRETLADVARARPELERRGVRTVFVHMAEPERAQRFFERYGLGDAERVSDPQAEIYRAPIFHLLKTTVLPEYYALGQLSTYFARGLRYGFGSAGKEDATQLPGVFFVEGRRITKAFRHKRWTDRPDYALFGL